MYGSETRQRVDSLHINVKVADILRTHIHERIQSARRYNAAVVVDEIVNDISMKTTLTFSFEPAFMEFAEAQQVEPTTVP